LVVEAGIISVDASVGGTGGDDNDCCCCCFFKCICGMSISINFNNLSTYCP
jgi:hypothetical protein